MTLTPVGAELAGNTDGTIGAWSPAERRGSLAGEYPRNERIDAEKPLFTITAANMQQYADHLDEGHKALLGKYETYKMNVYPSHRVVTYPGEILAATAANAEAKLTQDGKLLNAKLGFPFPYPASGAEVIWNHQLRWRGNATKRFNAQIIVKANGDHQLTKAVEDTKYYYASLKEPVPAAPGAIAFKSLSQLVEPPRLAGSFVLVHEKIGSSQAWQYSPGLKRIRRAPNVAYDNPVQGADGYQFYDQVDMFNGDMDRYDVKLIGKKELYIPYNSNRIAGPTVRYKDMAAPSHLNPELPRYELHRVWVVEFTLKPGSTHIFKKRVMYLDEDSWTIVGVENYDHGDQLAQYQEGHLVFEYNILSATPAPQVIYHFARGEYLITRADNEDKPVNATVDFNSEYFEAAAVQKMILK